MFENNKNAKDVSENQSQITKIDTNLKIKKNFKVKFLRTIFCGQTFVRRILRTLFADIFFADIFLRTIFADSCFKLKLSREHGLL